MNQIARYGMFEISMPRTNQKMEQLPQAVFAHAGKSMTIHGFSENENQGRVRFMPMEEGNWQYEMTWGNEKQTGSFECTPAQCHGPVRVDGCHFRYDDGSRYIPVGTTCYAWVHQLPEVIADTLETLKTAPFNKMRMCVFPKSMPYNQNDPEFYPFERKGEGWDVTKPDSRYWEHLDRCLAALEEMGIEADIILFHPYDRWGFSKMPQSDNLIYLDYAVRRLSAYHHVWWALSNEYEFSFAKTIADWDQFGELLEKNDPYQHLISAHNWITPYPKRPWLTHVSYQGSEPREAFRIRTEYQIPVVVDELGYEGDIEPNWGNLSGFDFMNRVWSCTAFGCYGEHGETFHRDDEVLWWAKGGKLYGQAPARLRFLRDFLESLPGPMEPACAQVVTDPNGMAKKAEGNSFLQSILNMHSEAALNVLRREQTQPIGAHPDYKLFYLGRCTRSLTTLQLPENGSYKVEIIDMWEMTRRLGVSNVRGEIKIGLPGKEGIAILVTRLSGDPLNG